MKRIVFLSIATVIFLAGPARAIDLRAPIAREWCISKSHGLYFLADNCTYQQLCFETTVHKQLDEVNYGGLKFSRGWDEFNGTVKAVMEEFLEESEVAPNLRKKWEEKLKPLYEKESEASEKDKAVILDKAIAEHIKIYGKENASWLDYKKLAIRMALYLEAAGFELYTQVLMNRVMDCMMQSELNMR
jgi:hypothetical protein